MQILISDNKRNKIVLPDRFRSPASQEWNRRLEKRHPREKNLAQVSIRRIDDGFSLVAIVQTIDFE